MPQTQVIVTHREVGFHKWPEAPDSVAYLRDLHRHLFLFILAWDVRHDDRDVEFHTAQSWVRHAIDGAQVYGAMSCEMIAKALRDSLVAEGHPEPAWVEVWEDGESGARVTFP